MAQEVEHTQGRCWVDKDQDHTEVGWGTLRGTRLLALVFLSPEDGVLTLCQTSCWARDT